MRNFDRTPLYRTAVGFDQVVDLMDRILTADPTPSSYPPYNIEKTGDDAWRISVAVAGFGEEDLDVEVKENALHIVSRKEAEGERRFLHRGIATRAFDRRFHLADHVRVSGASHQDGMLHIDLLREVPEALKPRKIEIVSAAPKQLDAA